MKVKIKCPKCSSSSIRVLTDGTVYCTKCEVELKNTIFTELFRYGMYEGEELYKKQIRDLILNIKEKLIL